MATMFHISLKAAWQLLQGSGGAWAGGEGRVSLVFSVTKCKGPTQWAVGATELQTTQTSPSSGSNQALAGPTNGAMSQHLSPPRH